MKIDNFFSELKRRNVYKVAITYAVVAWLLIQAASILLPTFEAPAWVMKAFVVLLALGFALVVFISWAFEATPEGLKRTRDVPSDVAARAEGAGRRRRAQAMDTRGTRSRDLGSVGMKPCHSERSEESVALEWSILRRCGSSE